MEYSLPYIVFIVFILVVSVLQLGIAFDKSSQKYINFSVFFAYILFWGFRGFIGWDWVNYYPFFKDLSITQPPLGSNYDIAFEYYSFTIKYLFKTYESFVLVSTIVNALLLHIVFRRYLPERYYALAFALFFAFNGLIFETDLMRNIKSLLIFLISIKYIIDRKPLQYFSLIALAVIFHWSALIFIPLYFFLHKKVSLKFFLIIFVLGNLIYLLRIEYITPVITYVLNFLPEDISARISMYIKSQMYSKPYGITFGYIERSIMSFLLFFYYQKITKDVKGIIFMNSFIVYIFLFLYCSEISIILIRLAGNYAFAYWFLVPMIIHNSEKGVKPFIYIFFTLIIVLKIHLLTNNVLYEYDSTLIDSHKDYRHRKEIYDANYKRLEK